MYQPPRISNGIGFAILEKLDTFTSMYTVIYTSGCLPVLPAQNSMPIPTSITGTFQQSPYIFKPPVQHWMEREERGA